MNAVIPATEIFDVEFPAIVHNVERAISMLGGEQGIYETFSNSKRTLNLMFRPDMFYCKPATGEPTPVKALALKVQRCRNKITGEIKIFVSVLGRVVKMYQFTTFADFQYGPFERINPPCTTSQSFSSTKNLPEYQVFYDKLLIREPTTFIDPYLSQDVPLFIPPNSFCRYDHCITYNFAPRYRTSELIELEETQKLPLLRKPRPSYSIVINPGDPVPKVGHPEAVESVTRLGATGEDSSEHYKQLFDRRPIWLTAALRYESPQDTRTIVFQKILRANAYHIHRGPWARAWIRFGYDPHKDPEARFYQVVDFRLQSFKLVKKLLRHSLVHRRLMSKDDVRKLQASSSSTTKSRTAESSVPNDLNEDADDVDMDQDDDEDEEDVSDSDSDGLGKIIANEVDDDDDENPGTRGKVRRAQENEFIFGPDHWPTTMQVRYCLIDIRIPEVQAIVAEKPERTEIDQVDGWLKPGSMKRIRTLMAQNLKKWITNARNSMGV